MVTSLCIRGSVRRYPDASLFFPISWMLVSPRAKCLHPASRCLLLLPSSFSAVCPGSALVARHGVFFLDDFVGRFCRPLAGKQVGSPGRTRRCSIGCRCHTAGRSPPQRRIAHRRIAAGLPQFLSTTSLRLPTSTARPQNLTPVSRPEKNQMQAVDRRLGIGR